MICIGYQVISQHVRDLLRYDYICIYICIYIYVYVYIYATCFSSCVENISLVRCANLWNIFQHSKINFISPCCHVISSIYSINRHSLTARFWRSYWLNHVMESCIIITSSAMVDCILHQVYYFLIQHLWKMTGFDLQLHLRYRDSLLSKKPKCRDIAHE